MPTPAFSGFAPPAPAPLRSVAFQPPSRLPEASNELFVHSEHGARSLYDALMKANGAPEGQVLAAAREFLEKWRAELASTPTDLPREADGLPAWLEANLAGTGAQYQAYLSERKAGAPRRYFSNRSHALFFLRSVAPTKLVDGSWLYGLLSDSANPRFSDLLFTYVEELGDGDPDKNHVLLYRRLLDSQGIVDWADQPDENYVQGALQLALAACTETMVPEVIGFNLGYEQLPLHLLITSYELDELGIDPTYFTLHVTVDNAAGGHAQRALRSVVTGSPALADSDAFWHRLEDGYRLSGAGFGTTDAIGSFDLHEEFLRVLASRAGEGQASHSDYCRIDGKTINQWLAIPHGMAAFVDALERKGWLMRGGNPAECRFWSLLQGEKASMFGVFGDYELQVIYDWIRGDAAADGAHFVRSGAPASAPVPARAFRHARRAMSSAGEAHLGDLSTGKSMLDPDVAELKDAMAGDDVQHRGAVLRRLLGPSLHWTAAGLAATRHVSGLLRAQ